MTYPIKGKYYGWNMDDVPASELIRVCDSGEIIEIAIRGYVQWHRKDLDEQMKMKGTIPTLIEMANKKFNEATFIRYEAVIVKHDNGKISRFGPRIRK